MLDRSFLIGRRLFADAIEAFGEYCAANGRPDVIHAHNLKYAGFLAAAFRDRYKLPYVYTEHSSEMLSKASSIAIPDVLRKVISNSAGTTVVSTALLDSISALSGIDKSAFNVIPNFLPREFESCELTDGRKDEIFSFVNVAEALPIKRQGLLIEAFALYFKGTQTLLKIIGDGPELPRLRKLASRLDVSGQVVFHGRLTRPEIRKVLRRSHCFVLTSQHETFAVAAIEALSQGLPVVSTRCGGPESFIDVSNGLFAASDTSDGVGAAMASLRKTFDLYDSAEISMRCLRSYSSTAVVDSYVRLYTRALGR
jgi:glycosyltransferase involved in cell wall biosynthesis